MIQVKQGTVKLTEQTVRDLLSAIEEAKKVTTFTNDPLPDGDMDTETFIKLKRERGEIIVKSEYSGIEYAISIDKIPCTQESMRYKLILGKGTVRVGKDGRCLCKLSDKCPLGKTGSSLRCTEEELNDAGIQTVRV